MKMVAEMICFIGGSYRRRLVVVSDFVFPAFFEINEKISTAEIVRLRKHKAAAYGAIARKLLQILYGVLKKKPFQIQPTIT